MFVTNRSIRQEVALLLVFSTVVPFIATTFLLVSNYRESKENIKLVEKSAINSSVVYLDQFNDEFSNKVERVVLDEDLASFFHVSDELRGFSYNLLYGKISKLFSDDPRVANWVILNNEGSRLINWKETRLLTNDSNGWSFSGVNSLQYSHAISFDDQFQVGPGANRKGRIVVSFNIKEILKRNPLIKEIALNEGRLVPILFPVGHGGMSKTIYLLSLIAFIILVSSILGLLHVRKKIVKPLRKLTDSVYQKGELEIPKTINRNEIVNLEEAFNKYSDYVTNSRIKLLKAEREKAFNELSRQVAHDIRSPLSALQTVFKQIGQVEESERSIMRMSLNRINDIANNLLGSFNAEKRNIKDQLTLESLPSLLNSIVSEKRIEYSGRQLQIDFPIDETHHGCFSYVEAYQLKRIISNMLNNAIEALDNKVGVIQISLHQHDEVNVIGIKDNGCGIPLDLMPVVFDEGVSKNKKNGSGIGLYHAKKKVEEFKGSIDVQSEVGEGTLFTIKLPKAQSPKNFVKEIKLGVNEHVIILDDDPSIHELLQTRIKKLNLNVKIIHFYSPDEFLASGSISEQAQHFFIDHEYKNSKVEGLDVASGISQKKNVYLVTSHYEERKIRHKCNERNIGLIDKGMAGFIPIVKKVSYAKSVVLVEDDMIIKKLWADRAKQANIDLVVYENEIDLKTNLRDIEKDWEIYIDSDLNRHISGEEVAKELHSLGYTELYIQTGYPVQSFNNFSFLKGVAGKEPPWS